MNDRCAGARARRDRRPRRPSGAASKGPAAGKTVHVGVIADVTGAAGVYGTPQKNAYELANEDIKSGKIDAGGANLTFDVQDAATDGAQVVNLMQKFTTDGQTRDRARADALGRSVQGLSDREARELPGDGHLDHRRRRDGDRPERLPRRAGRIAGDPDHRQAHPRQVALQDRRDHLRRRQRVHENRRRHFPARAREGGRQRRRHRDVPLRTPISRPR